MKSKKPYTIIQVIQDAGELSVNETAEKKKAFLGNFKELPLDRIIIRKPHKWEGLLKISGMNNENKRAGVNKYSCCTFPWYSLTVFYDGKVFLCPQDFKGEICLGDAGREKIEEIFNGEAIKDMRKRFKPGIIDDIVPCRNCDRIRRKSFLGIPLEYPGVFIKDNLRK